MLRPGRRASAWYQKAQETQDEVYLAIPMIRLLGLRIGECLALSFSDFDSHTNRITIHRSMQVRDELRKTAVGQSGRIR